MPCLSGCEGGNLPWVLIVVTCWVDKEEGSLRVRVNAKLANHLAVAGWRRDETRSCSSRVQAGNLVACQEHQISVSQEHDLLTRSSLTLHAASCLHCRSKLWQVAAVGQVPKLCRPICTSILLAGELNPASATLGSRARDLLHAHGRIEVQAARLWA